MNIKIHPILKNHISKLFDIFYVKLGFSSTTFSKNEYINDLSILTFFNEKKKDIIVTPAHYQIRKNNRKISLIDDVAILLSNERRGVQKLMILHLLKLAKLKETYKTILNSNKKIGFKTEQIQLVKRY